MASVFNLNDKIPLTPIFFIEDNWNETIKSGRESHIKISCQTSGVEVKSELLVGAPRRANDRDDNKDVLSVMDSYFTVVGFWPANNALRIHFRNTFSCIFVAPLDEFIVHKKPVTNLDISETTTMCASVSEENECDLIIWSREHFPHRILHILKGHVGDVYRCVWFPSGTVLISTSADMRLKIWDGQTGRCAATLIGHTGAVTDLAIVHKGRNIISVSKDGFCKLWNCSKSHCLADIMILKSAINCISISDIPEKSKFYELSPNLATDDNNSGVKNDEGEIGTENKMIICGCEDGTVHGYAIRSRMPMFSKEFQSAVNCCCTISPGIFVLGCQDGSIYNINLLELERYSDDNGDNQNDDDMIGLVCWHESNYPVMCVTAYKQIGFFSSYQDGWCVYRTLKTTISDGGGDGLQTTLQLTANVIDRSYECPAVVRQMRYDNKYMYTGCDDGVIRRYFINPYIAMIK